MFGLEVIDFVCIQFVFIVFFYIIFLVIIIGLVSYLVVLEGFWLKMNEEVYCDFYYFWLKIFVVNFGMGVVFGLVMVYQFGINWSYFFDFVGFIIGLLLIYEVFIVFFFEVGFFGVMLFGWNCVGLGLYFFVMVMVVIGMLILMFWIFVFNSWMQILQGFEIVDGWVILVDWLVVIFNLLFFYCLLYMLVVVFFVIVFFVGVLVVWYLLCGCDNLVICKMFLMVMWMVLIVVLVQVLIGDVYGFNILEYQLVKIVVMEGYWDNSSGELILLILFGWLDMQCEEICFKVEILVFGSLIFKYSLIELILVLKDFLLEDWLNFIVVFWLFWIMVGFGMLMILVGVWSLWLCWCGQDKLFNLKVFLCLILLMGLFGLIVIFVGWFIIEMGCQFWVVYGLMCIVDVFLVQSVMQMSLILLIFVVVYFLLFGVGIGYMMCLVCKGLVIYEGCEINLGGVGQKCMLVWLLLVVGEGFDEEYDGYV